MIYAVEGSDLNEGDRCEKGSQLRPHIVWFGEMVPELENAAYMVSMADIFLVIGTSLQVYPAAGLTNYAPPYSEKYYIDPNAGTISGNFKVIKSKAGEGVPKLVKKLIEK